MFDHVLFHADYYWVIKQQSGRYRVIVILLHFPRDILQQFADTQTCTSRFTQIVQDYGIWFETEWWFLFVCRVDPLIIFHWKYLSKLNLDYNWVVGFWAWIFTHIQWRIDDVKETTFHISLIFHICTFDHRVKKIER